MALTGQGGQSTASYLGSAVDWPPALYAPFTPNPKVAYFCAALWSGFTPPLTPDTGFVPSNLVAEGDFTTQDTSETISSFFESRDQKISVGVWECAPCREEIKAYPVDEMMTVISGALTLTGSDGTAQEFVAGDTFFIPKGTPCVWEITRTLRKFYMIAE